MAQTLKFGNKVWAAKEDSVLAYNDINNNYKPLPFDFARASIGTRVNKDGLIETMGQDIARIDYTDSADGVLLLEPSSTNLITNSNDFTTGWTDLISGSGVNPVVTSNQGISPDGTLNADKVVFDLNEGTSSSDFSLLNYSLSGFSNPHTLDTSIYLKSSDSNNYQVAIYNRGTSVQIITVTNQWQRFSVNGTRSNTINNFRIGLFGDNSSNTASLLLFGAQAELNSFSTSYIATSGSTVTRAAETCNNSGNSEVFNDSEGVLFGNISALVAGGGSRYLSISDGSFSNIVSIFFDPSPNTIAGRIAVGGASIFLNATGQTQTNYNKIALKWKVNDYKFYINGFEVGASVSGGTFPESTLSEISFNYGGVIGAADMYGKTKEVGCYDTALTDLELETLTSYRNWVSMVNELNLNIIYNG